MNNIKKLASYCLDCIKSTGRNDNFLNLKSKENKIFVTNDNIFEADNKSIIKIMNELEQNKTVMSLYTSKLMLCGCYKNKIYYTPILYNYAELKRTNDKIELIQDEETIINFSLLASLLDEEEEIIEKVTSDLLEIENLEKVDFKKILAGLINIEKLEIKEEKTIILSKTAENIAGLMNELKQIINFY